MSKGAHHMKICERLNSLHARKNADYGDSFSKSYAEYGLVVTCIKMGEKLDRLKSLREKEALVTEESIADTLMDMANYAIMTIMELEGDNEG